MTERDVLICGCCSTQFSDLKVFIDHKQICGSSASSASSVSSSNDVCQFVSTTQQATHFGSQQIVLPSQSHASIVSLPVGMPHVFLQTSSGLSQMYRIVLEPSAINSGLQLSQPCQVQNLFQQPNISSTETQYGMTPEGKSSVREHQDTPLSKKQEANEKVVQVGSSLLTLNDSSMTRLALMNPVDTSWAAHRTETPTTATFETLDSGNISDKTSNLHTEEEVATFLATQLVTQSTSSNTVPVSKTRENANITKYNIVLEDQPSNQSNSNFLESNQKLNKSVQARDNDIKNVNSFNKKSTGKNVKEASIQCLEGREIIEKGTKKIACTFDNCKFSTLHKKDMVRHVRKHTGEKPFQCPECGLKLSRQDKLKVHLRIHSKERPYACTEPGCSYRGNEREHLRKHIRTHTNERPFRCQFCPYGARDGSHLTVHLRSHTGDAPFHCQVDGCAAAFKTSSDLKRHEKLHTGEKPFKCTHCDYACTLKANLKVHFRINHCKDEKLSCKSCPFIASSRKQLKEHEINHPYFPPLSAKENEIKASSKRDGSTSDNDFFSQAKPVPQQTEAAGKKIGLSKGRRSARPFCPKNYKCGECGSAFVREDSYRSHIRQHDRARKEEERKALACAKELQELNQKEKAKPVYTLNYILQDTNTTNLSRVELDLQKNRNPVIKEAKIETILPTRSAINSASIRNSQAIPNGTASTSEVFSTYMITIDGIPSVYSAAKDPQLTDSQSLTQDDPVVHILSSPISHSIPNTNVLNASPKIIPIDEEIIEQSIT